jgi:hypothetical protein
VLGSLATVMTHKGETREVIPVVVSWFIFQARQTEEPSESESMVGEPFIMDVMRDRFVTQHSRSM